jgi:dimethylhistidine N-methyltransferase
MIVDRQGEANRLALAPSVELFRSDVLCGLRLPAKQIPSKYFYDETGSQIFEEICRLREYYPTRTELGIMQQHAGEMAKLLGRDCLLIEYGSGSSVKTRLLLDRLAEPAAYMPIDISGEHLLRSAESLAQAYPGLEIIPLCADFTMLSEAPSPSRKPARRVIYFPGSTIGNFTPGEAVELLRRTARLAGPSGGMLLGADRKKEPSILHAAYNDAQGVTACFNLNLLVRINRELGADFPIEEFWHHAFYTPRHGRIEMHLVTRKALRVRVADEEFLLTQGESIRTEYSYKYSVEDLQAVAAKAGFAIERTWTDRRGYFSVLYLTVA